MNWKIKLKLFKKLVSLRYQSDSLLYMIMVCPYEITVIVSICSLDSLGECPSISFMSVALLYHQLAAITHGKMHAVKGIDYIRRHPTNIHVGMSVHC